MSEPEAAPAAPAVAPTPPSKKPGKGLLASILIGLAGAGFVCGLILLGMNVARMSGGSGSSEIVVVDVSAIVNAQRAAMDADPVEGRMTVMRAGKVAEEVIRKIAGEDAVILVKQSVVALDSSNVRDITQQVLEELQLPTTAAPTVRIPPVASHLYSEQGKALLDDDKRRQGEENTRLQAWKEERERKDSLIP